MRIITWNIRHGGGERVQGIVAELARHDADAIVLTEARLSAPTLAIRAELASMGYTYQFCAGAHPRQNSAVVASKEVMAALPIADLPVEHAHRMVGCSWSGLDIVAVYMPAVAKEIESFYGTLTSLSREWSTRPTLLVGDWNSWAGPLDLESETFRPSKGMLSLIEQGWTDIWRHAYPAGREFTWVSNRGNGFRIDVAFLSPAGLPALVSAQYHHGPRLAGTSDHSLLSLELDWPRSDAMGTK